MNEFIEVKDDDGNIVLLNVGNISLFKHYGSSTVMVNVNSGASIMIEITLPKLKKLLGLTKKR